MRQATKIVRRLHPDTAQGAHPTLRHRATTSLGEALIQGGAVRAVQATTHEKSIREVFAEVASLNAQLNVLDDQIAEAIRTIEFHLRRKLCITKILKAPIGEGATLGWSCRRGYWRLVVVDEHEDGGAIDLLSTSRGERCEAFTSGAMGRIVSQAQDLVTQRRSRA